MSDRLWSTLQFAGFQVYWFSFSTCIVDSLFLLIYSIGSLEGNSLKSYDLTISSALGRHLSQSVWFLPNLEVYLVYFQKNMVLLQVEDNPRTKGGRVGKNGVLSFPKPGLLNTSPLLCFQTFTYISLNTDNSFWSSAYFYSLFYTSLCIPLFPPLTEIWERVIYDVGTSAAYICTALYTFYAFIYILLTSSVNQTLSNFLHLSRWPWDLRMGLVHDFISEAQQPTYLEPLFPLTISRLRFQKHTSCGVRSGFPRAAKGTRW